MIFDVENPHGERAVKAVGATMVATIEAWECEHPNCLMDELRENSKAQGSL